MGLFKRFRENSGENKESITQKFMKGLSKTSNSFAGAVSDLFTRSNKIDEDLYEELEEILIGADVGVATTLELINRLRHEAKEQQIKESHELRHILIQIMKGLFRRDLDIDQKYSGEGPTVVLFVGVNGVGKTTSIGKLAHFFKQRGKKVVLAAGDTFRAGAIEQLEIWGDRAGVDVIKHQSGADPAAVIYDGVQAAVARKADVLLCDTAGRLQNKVNLMEELKKIHRVVDREIPGAPHEVLLVLDATTGQNALIQAKKFKEAVHVSGVVLTKLDGTAKGGIVIAIRHELGLPVRYVGLGEKLDDLQEFDTDEFLRALFSEASTKKE